jgi:NAD+ dependent glucose-6-phosphate dehydrogenase
LTKTVLIAGATGNIGRKLRAHLEATGKYALRFLCLNPERDPTVHTADLSVYDEDWAAEFNGVDTVLLVAADPSPRASWARIQSRNIDLLLNVMAAAQLHRVRRVVFASSNFVVAGHRFARSVLSTSMEPAPINAYGASKLFGERVGKMFAERYGISFIAFRIGVCQRANGNQHGPWIPYGAWGQAMWVSDRDLCGAFELAIDDEGLMFGVYNLMSNNPGMRWEIESLARDLGFVPQDGEKIRVPTFQRVKAGMAWFRDVALRSLGERLAGPRW